MLLNTIGYFLQKLQSTEYKAIKVMLGLPLHTSSSRKYVEAQMFTLQKYRELACCKFVIEKLSHQKHTASYIYNFILWFKIIYHNKGGWGDGQGWGGWAAPLVERFLFTMQSAKQLCQRLASKYAVLPNWNKAGFQCVIVRTKNSTTYCPLISSYI